MKFAAGVAVTVLLAAVQAIDLNVDDKTSVREAADSIAENLFAQYHASDGSAPYLLEEPYYWWESGVFWHTLLDYSILTNTTKYTSQIAAALRFQSGDDRNYMPANQSISLANDDMAYWASAAMTAAEHDLPQPLPYDIGKDSWDVLATTAWKGINARWDEETCGGGLRWSIFSFSKGYDFKNSAANLGFFLLSTRLARYTGNTTYSETATKVWDWMEDTGLLEDRVNATTNTKTLAVYDGADTSSNCTVINKLQMSAYHGQALHGASILAAISNEGKDSPKELWRDRVAALVAGADAYFFRDGVMVETGCEPDLRCNLDMRAYKGVLASSIYKAQIATGYDDLVSIDLTKTAQAVAKSCAEKGDSDDTPTPPSTSPQSATTAAPGASNEEADVTSPSKRGAALTEREVGAMCAFSWNRTDAVGIDEVMATTGVGEQMNALQVMLALLVDGDTAAPGTRRESDTPTDDAVSGGGGDGDGDGVNAEGAASTFGVGSAVGVAAVALGFAALL